MKKVVVKKHPLAIRWFHWVNFPVLTIMIWSGLLIYWANGVYKISIGNTTIIKFFPDGFYKALKVPFQLAKGMNFHFAFAWLLSSMDFYTLLILFFPVNGATFFPIKNHLKKRGRFYCMICIYAGIYRRRKNITRHNALLILQ